jgi:hypothetical protein
MPGIRAPGSTAPLEIGKDAVAPLGAQRVEALITGTLAQSRLQDGGGNMDWYASISRRSSGSAVCPSL